MAEWVPYLQHYTEGTHTVVGDVRVLPQVRSPQLGNERDLLVYLPPSYGDGARRYPVIYMHDGQNCFDAATSAHGEWQADETMAALSREGLEAIIVGIPVAGADRCNEYLPWYEPKAKGGGDALKYLAFVTETVKPLIDADFRTLPDREHTGILGSSLGGLISLYALLKYPHVYGLAGIFSPAFWPARSRIFSEVAPAEMLPARIYLDTGTHEDAWSPVDRWTLHYFSWRTTRSCRRMRRLLADKGHELKYVEERGARHHEAAWARRLPDALRYLLSRLG